MCCSEQKKSAAAYCNLRNVPPPTSISCYNLQYTTKGLKWVRLARHFTVVLRCVILLSRATGQVGGWSDIGGSFSPSSFGFRTLIVIPPFLHTYYRHLRTTQHTIISAELNLYTQCPAWELILINYVLFGSFWIEKFKWIWVRSATAQEKNRN
jgi:hypothetical protein